MLGSEQRQLHIKTVRFHIPWSLFPKQLSLVFLHLSCFVPTEKRGVSAFSPGPGSRARAALAAGRSGLLVTTALSRGFLEPQHYQQEGLQKVGRMQACY